MDKFLIKGGKPLHGTVAIAGAKNSALPVMTSGPTSVAITMCACRPMSDPRFEVMATVVAPFLRAKASAEST